MHLVFILVHISLGTQTDLDTWILNDVQRNLYEAVNAVRVWTHGQARFPLGCNQLHIPSSKCEINPAFLAGCSLATG